MENIWAIVEGGVITNQIVAEEDFATAASSDGIAINLNDYTANGEQWPNIGWTWDGEFFNEPTS